MDTEDRTIGLEKIHDMKTAAILSMYRFTIQTAQLVSNTSHVVFSHIVGRHRKPEFDGIAALCEQGYTLRFVRSLTEVMAIAASEDPEVAFQLLPTLGDYEREFHGVRKIIDEVTKEAQTDE